MTAYPYVTFANSDNQYTCYLPDGTEAQRVVRSLAVSVWQEQCRLREANIDTNAMTVLVPSKYLSAAATKDVHGGSIMGVPLRVVDGIDGPMIAFDLTVRDMP